MIGRTTAPPPEAEAAHPHNRLRIGYARVSTRGRDYQYQRDALAAAHCREVVTETASTPARPAQATHNPRPPPARRPSSSTSRTGLPAPMKELLVLVEDELHARGINILEMISGVCARVYRPGGADLADRLDERGSDIAPAAWAARRSADRAGCIS